MNKSLIILTLLFVSLVVHSENPCDIDPLSAECQLISQGQNPCDIDPLSAACQSQANPPPGGQQGHNLNPGAASAKIKEALFSLCGLIKNVLGVGMMFMVVASALVYSLGQTMGAETRARASVWATSMFNGAIIAALIYLLVPFVLRTMLSGTGVDSQITCFILF